MHILLLDIMEKEFGLNVVSVDNPNFYKVTQSIMDRRELLVLYILDVVDHYKEKIKFVEDRYSNYLICTAGPYNHPKNIVNLDLLIETQQYNQNVTVSHNTHKKFDFLFMPGKNQIWRLNLIKEFLEQETLDNSLWSLSNPPGSVVDIKERKMPVEYELPNFDLRKVVYENITINRVIVPAQYADTRCSIVCETTISDDRIYPTEKTWKPLLAGTSVRFTSQSQFPCASSRPWIPHFLKYLERRSRYHAWPSRSL